MTTSSGKPGFQEYAADAWPRLVRTAHLLTGDPYAAEELARTTLADVYARWRRIPRDDTDFYVRRTLVRAHLKRRRGARPQQPPLARALAALPARQRVVLVLRLGEDLAEAEIAEVLGCSVGTVKSYARRGLEALSAVPLAGARR